MDETLWCYHSNETSSVKYFHMVLFIKYVFLTFEYVDETLWCYHSNETSSVKYFHMVLFIKYVFLTFEYVDEILWCYHSNETSFTVVLSHGTIYLVCISNF